MSSNIKEQQNDNATFEIGTFRHSSTALSITKKLLEMSNDRVNFIICYSRSALGNAGETMAQDFRPSVCTNDEEFASTAHKEKNKC